MFLSWRRWWTIREEEEERTVASVRKPNMFRTMMTTTSPWKRGGDDFCPLKNPHCILDIRQLITISNLSRVGSKILCTNLIKNYIRKSGLLFNLNYISYNIFFSRMRQLILKTLDSLTLYIILHDILN